ncbi:MAG TPA: hypothetical protein VF768_07120 [Holophagaceae bacterium]
MHSVARFLASGLLCFPAAARPPARAAVPPLEIVEQASHEGFPLDRPFLDQGPGSLQAVGVFLRFREGRKLYALCLYVDVPRLRALAPPSHRTPEQLARLLVSGKVPHAFITRFVEPLSRTRRMRFLMGNLEKAWPDRTFDPQDPGLLRFGAFFDRDVPRGAETQVWVDDHGTVSACVAGGPATQVRDPRLGWAFTASYLGDQPMDPVMKRALLAQLPRVLTLDQLFATPVRTR